MCDEEWCVSVSLDERLFFFSSDVVAEFSVEGLDGFGVHDSWEGRYDLS